MQGSHSVDNNPNFHFKKKKKKKKKKKEEKKKEKKEKKKKKKEKKKKEKKEKKFFWDYRGLNKGQFCQAMIVDHGTEPQNERACSDGAEWTVTKTKCKILKI